jgi:uncharacterized protein
MYEERTYRQISKPDDLLCYEVTYKESDLFCCTSVDLATIIKDRVLYYRNQLETYIRQRPEFHMSLSPIQFDPFAPKIAKEMMTASSHVGVGPMACVAGAMAEFIGRDITPLSDEYIIENGGDISMLTRKERNVVIYANDSPYSRRIGVAVKPAGKSLGICTSSATVGPSLSLGRADAVCIFAESALFADGLATRLGNSVHKADDISRAIEDGQQFPQVKGILVIMGKNLGAWGDIDLIEV